MVQVEDGGEGSREAAGGRLQGQQQAWAMASQAPTGRGFWPLLAGGTTDSAEFGEGGRKGGPSVVDMARFTHR